MRALLKKISEKIKKAPGDFRGYEDLYFMCLDGFEDNTDVCVEYLKWLSGACARAVLLESDGEFLRSIYELHEKVLLKISQVDFDSFLLYVEWDRDPDKKFYYPRREKLKPIVDAMQELADDKLDLLAVSTPPGIGMEICAMIAMTAANRPE